MLCRVAESGRAGAASGNIRTESAVVNEHYVVMTVECPRCKTKQRVHVADPIGPAQMVDQMIACLDCNTRFRLTLPNRIIRGPFPA